jgi:hypothetical protein
VTLAVALDLLAQAALVLALLFAGMVTANLLLFRPPPPPSGRRPKVSLLIPARDEEDDIGAALDAALASRGVDLEVVALDDHSADRTAAIVAERAARDPRLRLESAPALPAGWNGKQHACWTLSRHARYPLLAFIDADVRLAPDGLARLAAGLERGRLDLHSAFPRQETGALGEALLVPQIHVLLLGYLPFWIAWAFPRAPGFATGCGQLMLARADAYARAGGHAAIRASRHDGLKLPRAFRRAGLRTGVCDGTALARCRMYRGLAEAWAGFAKNATEGMATPTALPVWTVLLGGGHLLPFALWPLAALTGAEAAAAKAALACGAIYAARVALAWRFRQNPLGVALHPVGVALVLRLQWAALRAARRGETPLWRGRAYTG